MWIQQTKAARRGDESCVRILLQHGACPRISDSMKRSPLHMACRARSAPVMTLLIKYGADRAAKNFLNETPTHYARYEEDSHRLLELLIITGTDVNAPSKAGLTMLNIVVQRNFGVAAQYLLAHDALADGPPSSAAMTNFKEKPLGTTLMNQADRVITELLRAHCGVTFIDSQGRNVLHMLAKYGDVRCVEQTTHR